MLSQKCRKLILRCCFLGVSTALIILGVIFRLHNQNKSVMVKQLVTYISQEPGIGQAALQQADESVVQNVAGLAQTWANLQGRHSDFVLDEPCLDPDHKYNWKSKTTYDFIGPFDYRPEFKNPCFYDNHQKLRCVPYFYIIGAPKAGTTDVYMKVNKHPQVRVGTTKEPRWFDRRRFGEHFEYGKLLTFEDFLNSFNGASSSIKDSYISKNGEIFYTGVIGDGSPTTYFSSYYWKSFKGNEGCSEPRVTIMSHIHHLWPRTKLILMLRDPVDRLYSSYHFNFHLFKGNGSKQEFHQWVKEAIQVWNSCLKTHPFRYCMYDRQVENSLKLFEFHIGLYSRYVLDILRLFPRDQLLVVPMEDYSVRNKYWMSRIFEFLELEPLSDAQLQHLEKLQKENKNDKKERQGDMFPETRVLLTSFYRPFNEELAAILGDDTFLWNT